MSEDKVFDWRDGIPTGPDVEALLKAFPVEALQPGLRITDAEVRAHIGRSDGNRFRTVTSAWRKRLRKDHGVNLYRAENQGFYVPSTAEVLAQANPRMRHIGRTAKKHIREIAIVKPQNDIERNQVEHQGKLMDVLSRESRKARMNLLPATAANETPRISPPERAVEK